LQFSTVDRSHIANYRGLPGRRLSERRWPEPRRTQRQHTENVASSKGKKGMQGKETAGVLPLPYGTYMEVPSTRGAGERRKYISLV
jgi:hypothetical protein